MIDAKGNYVIPGVIDNHVHLVTGLQQPDKELRADTAAGAYGGVTTINNMMGLGAFTHKGSYVDVFEDWKKIHEGNAFTDFMIDIIISSDVHIKEMPLYAGKYGMPLFKLMLAYKGWWEAEQGKVIEAEASDGVLYSALKQIKAIGPPARLRVHCENMSIINRLIPWLRDEEKREDLAAWTDARPGWAEALDIKRVASIAKVVKAPIYIVHLSSAPGVDAVAKAKEDGVNVIAETTPAYLTLTKHSPLGMLGKINPPLRDEESIERLWEAINSGVVQCMGTDHGSHMKANKIKGGIWEAEPPGFAGIETYLPVLLSEGVNKGRITLEKLVEVCCANNARAMGLYPKKGVIRAGSDADLVIIDLNKKVKLSAETLHQVSDFCVHEGWEAKGYPVLTMLRGNIVVKDGKLIAKPGIGQYLARFSQV